MFVTRSLIIFVCAIVASCLVGCDRNKIADDKNEEFSPFDTKAYIIPALDKDHSVRIEVTADEDVTVVVGEEDNNKMGEVLAKPEKSKAVKLDVKIPKGKEGRIEIHVDKKCTAKTSIRSI
jgi:hypothetical protein